MLNIKPFGLTFAEKLITPKDIVMLSPFMASNIHRPKMFLSDVLTHRVWRLFVGFSEVWTNHIDTSCLVMWGSLYFSTTENLTQMKDLINLMRQELFISTTNALFCLMSRKVYVCLLIFSVKGRWSSKTWFSTNIIFSLLSFPAWRETLTIHYRNFS